MLLCGWGCPDPVTLRLPAVCRCPVVQHPTDSITLSEINRLPGPARRLRIKLARSLETRVLRSGYASSIYNSPQDADLARSLIAETEQARIVTMPIGVDSGVFHPATSKPDRQPVRVIFSGVMNYRPNVMRRCSSSVKFYLLSQPISRFV